MCRSCKYRQELSNEDPYSNEYLLATIGVDTAENEPLEVWGENSIQYSIVSLVLCKLQIKPLFRAPLRLEKPERTEQTEPCATRRGLSVCERRERVVRVKDTIEY